MSSDPPRNAADELTIETIAAQAPTFDHAKPGAFVFSSAGGEEILRFEPDGRVFVRGAAVEDTQKIYEAVAAFFQRATRCTACNELRDREAVYAYQDELTGLT